MQQAPMWLKKHKYQLIVFRPYWHQLSYDRKLDIMYTINRAEFNGRNNLRSLLKISTIHSELQRQTEVLKRTEDCLHYF